jgi:hypothetical protein
MLPVMKPAILVARLLEQRAVVVDRDVGAVRVEQRATVSRAHGGRSTARG